MNDSYTAYIKTADFSRVHYKHSLKDVTTRAVRCVLPHYRRGARNATGGARRPVGMPVTPLGSAPLCQVYARWHSEFVLRHRWCTSPYRNVRDATGVGGCPRKYAPLRRNVHAAPSGCDARRFGRVYAARPGECVTQSPWLPFFALVVGRKEVKQNGEAV